MIFPAIDLQDGRSVRLYKGDFAKETIMTTSKCPVTHLTMNNGAPRCRQSKQPDRRPTRPMLAQDLWLNEKLADFVREVIPERRMHAKGSGAFGTFTVTHDITKYTRAKIFSEVGKQTEMFARFTTVAGERGAAMQNATSAALR